MSQTRETFSDIPGWAVVLWYVLIAVQLAVFSWGAWRLVLKYRRGREPGRPVEWSARRVAHALGVVLSHAWIRRRAGISGLAHAGVFYGFVVLFIGTSILAFQDDFADPVLGFDFWHGWFYLGYSLFLDVFGAVLTMGLAALAVKRGIVRPARLDYRRPGSSALEEGRRRYVIGDWAFLGSLLFLAVTGFVLEGIRIAVDDPSFETWAPFGWLLGQGFQGIGLDGAAASDVHLGLWWAHGLVALTFVASIPYTKALHIATGPSSVALRDEAAGKTLVPLPVGAQADQVGYGTVGDLSWRELIQLDSCTKCGKCHEACPAAAVGLPLSPRDFVLDLREVAEGSIGLRADLGIGPLYDAALPLVGGVIAPETLWSCTQCMACVEICPVGIEHPPLITQFRRRLVEQGEMDTQLQQTLEKIFTTGNSFGEPRRKRARWAKSLPFEVKDIRKEPAEVLWFLGDYASLDPRCVQVTQALAHVLHQAGVDFGILHDVEKNAGCDVRRVGEEGLFTALASENVKNISGCSFDRILTWDPHSFHTLKNEYPALGGSWDVLHHSQLLLELLDRGVIEPVRPLDVTVTYHDPCTLGRYNGVYDAPRRVLAHLGVELREMPRNRDNSFCCGAGGGRIWMKDLQPAGARRPSELRIDEAVDLGGVDTFVVACPKDVTMYEDAIKTSGHEGRIELRELTELVLEALGIEHALRRDDEDVAPGVGSRT